MSAMPSCSRIMLGRGCSRTDTCTPSASSRSLYGVFATCGSAARSAIGGRAISRRPARMNERPRRSSYPSPDIRRSPAPRETIACRSCRAGADRLYRAAPPRRNPTDPCRAASLAARRIEARRHSGERLRAPPSALEKNGFEVARVTRQWTSRITRPGRSSSGF
jgi:hypothetical protein